MSLSRGKIIRFGIAAVVASAIVALAGVLVGGIGQASDGKVVKTKGDEQFVPNAKIMATLKFAPGNLVVASGEELTLAHEDKSDEPHTLTIIDSDEVPSDIEDVFNCGAPGTVCDDAFNLIFGAVGGEPTSSVFVNDPSTGAGIDGRLDSLVVFPGESISAPVTAAPGTTLYYFCAIHPWMQGTITVK